MNANIYKVQHHNTAGNTVTTVFQICSHAQVLHWRWLDRGRCWARGQTGADKFEKIILQSEAPRPARHGTTVPMDEQPGPHWWVDLRTPYIQKIPSTHTLQAAWARIPTVEETSTDHSDNTGTGAERQCLWDIRDRHGPPRSGHSSPRLQA